MSPGYVAWPATYEAERRERVVSPIPLGYSESGEDVAKLVRFLTVEAHYATGCVIPVDGGLSVRY